MGSYVLGFQEIDQTQVAVCGGKGAHLGELSRIEGITVPPGFCVTTDAFRRIMTEAPSIDDRLDELSRLHSDDSDAIRTISAEIRRTVEEIAIPDDLAAAITGALARLGEARHLRRAIERDGRGLADGVLRGPARHELERRGAGRGPPARQPVLGLALHRARRDLPPAERRRPPEGPDGCRRAADGLPGGGRHPLHGRSRDVQPEGHLVEASFGLGEALVDGLVNPDVYKVHDGEVVDRTVASKQLAIHAVPAGGTQERAIEPERQDRAGADGCAGRAARAAGPADRSALRPPSGHRMVPRR